MRVLCTVLCYLVTVTVVSTVRTKEECTGYETIIVTINEGREPYWYQMPVSLCIQGKTVPEINAYTIKVMEIKDESIKLLEVSDFPVLKEAFLDNIGLDDIPEFINVPKIAKISLASNDLTRISSKSVSRTSVKELIFSRNKINVIQKGAFGHNVETIYMTCNNISELSQTWFKSPAKITSLYFGGNRISSVPDNMFKDLVNLSTLDLRNNQITTIGTGSISGPTYMQSLSLAYNNITEIKGEVFGPNINISYFNVEYNRLSFLHQSMMDKMAVSQIRLWGNPWQCPCQRIIDAWIAKNDQNFNPGLPRDEDPSCVIALSFKNNCVPFVDNDLYETFLMTFETSPVDYC